MDHGHDPQNGRFDRFTAENKSDDGVVIDVADVEPATAPVPEAPYRSAIDAAVLGIPYASPLSDGSTPVEACSDDGGRLIPVVGSHAGLAAVHLAYANHMPLILSPDILWLLVAQGVAHHINANAESLRRRVVRHQGQVRLEVERHQFKRGAPDNDWAGVIDEFSFLIREHIGEATHALFEPRFSTTAAVEKAAAQVVLLDAMKSYFRYSMMTMCGIPQVVLQGTPRDWASLSERVEALCELELQWWVDALRPILDEFNAAVNGAANPDFWQHIYKRQHASGGPYISGWITAFFPYLRDLRRESGVLPNDSVRKGGQALRDLLAGTGKTMGGFTSDQIPNGLSEAPVQWTYFDRRYDMRFVAGFVGVRQDVERLSVRPEIGWAIYEPAQLDAARAQSEVALAQAEREAMDRAFARGSAWISKGRCQRCGEWIYRYDAPPLREHCGAPVVDVSYR